MAISVPWRPGSGLICPRTSILISGIPMIPSRIPLPIPSDPGTVTGRVTGGLASWVTAARSNLASIRELFCKASNNYQNEMDVSLT